MGSLISLLLTETGGKPLQDDIEDTVHNGKVAPVNNNVIKTKRKMHNGTKKLPPRVILQRSKSV